MKSLKKIMLGITMLMLVSGLGNTLITAQAEGEVSNDYVSPYDISTEENTIYGEPNIENPLDEIGSMSGYEDINDNTLTLSSNVVDISNILTDKEEINTVIANQNELTGLNIVVYTDTKDVEDSTFETMFGYKVDKTNTNILITVNTETNKMRIIHGKGVKMNFISKFNLERLANIKLKDGNYAGAITDTVTRLDKTIKHDTIKWKIISFITPMLISLYLALTIVKLKNYNHGKL
ncbi:TPM domain-containing protein [Inconstantimicrobium porci]|uniref:TPM domain-containing protein n=1 Tax=Inconstantimicrobium porci TaxID=2652291 RepID=A0A7X2T0P8_9CLOT|nr:TPM domain-containing protein [Inconstantimicrobium porci]MSR90764.1 TPM domain-containing protein [Inconstantimicrobium porci]